MKTKSNKTYIIALVLFIIVIISVVLSPVEFFRTYVVDYEEYRGYYRYYRLDFSLWDVFRDFTRNHEGLSLFLFYLFSNCLTLGALIVGVIGSSKEKKLVSLISVLILDVVCIIVVLSRFTGLGVGSFSYYSSYSGGWTTSYDGIKFSTDFLFQFVCLVALNVTVMLQKSEIVENTESVNNAQPNLVSRNVDAIDEIKKLKTLLDMGILTKEEFAMKKKELL